MSSAYVIQQTGGMYYCTSTITGWIDVFTRRHYRDIILDSLKYCIKHKHLHLHAWVIMSNHIHLIASTPDDVSLANVLRDFKTFTSKNILSTIAETGESRSEWMLQLFAQAGKQNAANDKYQLWQNGNHAVSLFSQPVIKQKLDYLHYNPVRNGLVSRPEDYLYSSAVDYTGEKGLIEIEPIIFKEFVR